MGNIINKEGLEHLAEVLDEKYGNQPVPQTMVKTTYAELKALRDGGKLVPGTWYRITDYECTTSQENTRSAGHRFDIIVLALDNKTLSEEARACLHEGDTYFSEAGAKLEAWKIWYCLDNDETRFAWAMKEYIFSDSMGELFLFKETVEYEGETYHRWVSPTLNTIHTKVRTPNPSVDHLFSDDFVDDLTENGETFDEYNPGGHGVIYRMIDERNNDVPYDFKNITFLREGLGEDGIDCFCYTFSAFEDGIFEGEEPQDESVFAMRYISEDNEGVFGNNIIRFYNFGTAIKLNDIVFYTDWSNESVYHSHNTFGNDCFNNTFGNRCLKNTFGNECFNNTFENGCNFNVFKNGCSYNTFGNDFEFNVFGNDCKYNVFGNDCKYNTFENKCSHNTFGTASSTKNYMRYITLENGVSYTYINCSATTSASKFAQNIYVNSGVAGASVTNRKTLTIPTAGNTFLTTFGSANDTTINV